MVFVHAGDGSHLFFPGRKYVMKLSARGLFEAHGNRTTPGTVRIRVLPPIQTAGMSRAEQKELPAAVRQTILAQL